MRNAETILGIIRERGSRGLPLEDVYRQLWNPQLYLLAYGRIARNHGALTAGTTPETADGMSLTRIQRIINALRCERYRWTPVRRVYIEKQHSTKKRPLGIPTWSDKLLQEVLRLLLEAYYEPQFSDHSHGFRPERGCHTALTELRRTWTGTTWFIEGDISACFDSIDHQVLLALLAERIHDQRFLRLISNLLSAGYLEEWTFNATYSGTPQGGIVSPLLANIYLDRLDQFVETTLLPAFNQGAERRLNPEYNKLACRMKYLKRTGRPEQAEALRPRLQTLPNYDTQDASYRRLRYLRYADDFLLGFTGPRAEAEDIKQQLDTFLRERLKLDLSPTKTLITHGRSEAARFLGYEVVVQHNDRKLDARQRRTANALIGLRVPQEVVKAKCAPYLRDGRPIHRGERLHDTPFSIIRQYQAEYRGLVNYYQLATNLGALQRLYWVMSVSLAKTLAAKLRISCNQVFRRYKTVIQTPQGPRNVLQATVERADKPPLVATWGGISLAHRRWQELADLSTLRDQLPAILNGRSELEKRLLAETCELCGSQEDVQVHHIRALKDLRPHGRTPRPAWVQLMAQRQRKTLVVCRRCHWDIHAGRSQRTLESHRDLRDETSQGKTS